MNGIARGNGWTEFTNHQCQYNLLYREEEREMLPYCRDKGIDIRGRYGCPFGRGSVHQKTIWRRFRPGSLCQD